MSILYITLKVRNQLIRYYPSFKPFSFRVVNQSEYWRNLHFQKKKKSPEFQGCHSFTRLATLIEPTACNGGHLPHVTCSCHDCHSCLWNMINIARLHPTSLNPIYVGKLKDNCTPMLRIPMFSWSRERTCSVWQSKRKRDACFVIGLVSGWLLEHVW